MTWRASRGSRPATTSSWPGRRGSWSPPGTRRCSPPIPSPERRLVTTLDPRLQTRAERLLAVPEGTESPATALVAIRPSDGAILAAASGLGGDGLNVATYGQYAPGSTFKVVSALALLRAGLTPQSRVSCPATTSVDGKSFKNYDDYPADATRGDHPAPGGGELVQHGVRGVGRRARARGPGGGGGRPGARGRPGPGVPGVLRAGAAAAQRDRGGSRPHRPGHGAGLPDDDGHRGGLGAVRADGDAVPARGRPPRGVPGRTR